MALQRDLHDWRAQFNFTRNATGQFRGVLLDLPDRPSGPQVRLQSGHVQPISVRPGGQIGGAAVAPGRPTQSWHRACTSQAPSHCQFRRFPCAPGGSSQSRLPRPAAPPRRPPRLRARRRRVPINLVGTSLDQAVALTWDDNAFLADPNNFQNYRVYSTTYTWTTDYLAGQCGHELAARGHDRGAGIRRGSAAERRLTLLRRFGNERRPGGELSAPPPTTTRPGPTPGTSCSSAALRTRPERIPVLEGRERRRADPGQRDRIDRFRAPGRTPTSRSSGTT